MMDLIYDVGVILLGIVLIIYSYFKYAYTYFEKRQIPFVEPSFPFGNFGPLAFRTKSLADLVKEFYNYIPDAPAIGIFNFSSPMLLIKDPKMIKQCLVKDFSSFHDRQPPINEEINPLFGHLFFLTGMKWRNVRTKLSPTFTSGKMKFMFDTLKDRTENFVQFLKNNSCENIDVEDSWTKLTTDIIAACAFGIDCNSLENPENEFRKYGIMSMESSLRLTIGTIFINSTKFLSKLVIWPLLENSITEYFINMVKDTISYREKNNIMKKDFMQLLIELKNNKKVLLYNEEEEEDNDFKFDDGKSLTEVQCAAQAFVFFLAGFGTTSTTLNFCVYELVQNPAIQIRLQEEIDKVIEEYGTFSYESINKMTFLEQVIKETLRKYPPVPWLNRIVTEPVDLIWNDKGQKIHLEEYLKIVISVYGLHHDPKYFPNPENFDPERFSEENKNSFPHYSYIPFGEGPHNCIGARFGMMQTKVGLAMLLHNFNIEMSDKTKLNLKIHPGKLLLAFDDKVVVNYVKRNVNAT